MGLAVGIWSGVEEEADGVGCGLRRGVCCGFFGRSRSRKRRERRSDGGESWRGLWVFFFWRSQLGRERVKRKVYFLFKERR